MPKVYLTDADRKKAAEQRRYDIISKRVRAYRAAERVKQETFAERAGCCRSVISRIETGKPAGVAFADVVSIVHAAKMPPEEWLALGGYKGASAP